MQTKAAVLYGKNDVRIREFELPKIKEDEILVKVISNGICLSTYKAAKLGEDHMRVPETIGTNPIITGHEFAGVIVEIGKKWKDQYKVGQKFVLQPAMGLPSGYSAGYSYEFFGGNATYSIIPNVAIELGCLLNYEGDYFANASLAEPMCCIIGAFNANYHTIDYIYEHNMGIVEGGNVALLASAGPMGLGAIDYAINGPKKPKLIVVTDIDDARLETAKKLIPESVAEEKGITLKYINTKDMKNPKEELLKVSNDKGFDDVFVFAAIKEVVELADEILGKNGCLNFFAGPTDTEFKVPMNFYNVHYKSTHVVGTSGGSTGDMIESLERSTKGLINPSYMVTHIGGLNAAPETILNLPEIPGGKKLIYPHIEMELTAISDFKELGKNDPLFKTLAEIVEEINGVWCQKAEEYLLEYHEKKKV